MQRTAAFSARFEILRPLGQGGMGVVYEALDRERNVRVALKTLRRFSPEALARFKREFRALAGLHHRNLVTLGELVSEGDQWFFTMELLDGVDFLTWVRPWYRAASGARLLGEGESAIRARDASTVTRAELTDAVTCDLDAPPSSVRDVPRFDEVRLREGIAQLAHGLVALHDADRVHCDVKPSNIRVAEDGRVVLLDFGLVWELEAERSQNEGEIAGTPEYMAPEQAARVTAAADWYGVGALLYHALTGRVPFDGAPMLVLRRKQSGAPDAPSRFVRDLPADLEQICLDLLEIDPARRPSGRELIERLGVEDRRSSSVPEAPPSLSARSSLRGRDVELEALRQAFDASDGSVLTAIVHGASGIGKTSLVRAFTDRLASERRDLFVLRGRCHEIEAVPYKALDDVIDLLCERLARMPDDAVTGLSPLHVGALLHIFPVLRRVRAFAREAEGHTSARTLDPGELRRRAFAAVRELFALLARRARTVVVIDDLQWADADSLSLLGALLRPPDAPPIFLIATERTLTDVARGESRARALVATIPGAVRVIRVGPLAAEDARRLAEDIVGGASGDLSAKIAIEAAGHPLFIEELARHARSGENEVALKLEDVLWSRIDALPPRARAVTELVAIAAAPLPQETVARAVAMEAGELASVVSLLRASNLVRTRGARSADLIEVYHDRVREAVLGHLEPGAKRARHGELAATLEDAKHPDAEALAIHWREGGHPARARVHALLAAEQAWDALAFDRAARWYRVALALFPTARGASEVRVIRVKLAGALASAGRSALAAVEYQEAASELGADGESAQSSPRSPPDEAIALLRAAAEQLFRCGRYEEGLALSNRVLATVGLEVPRTPFRVLAGLLFFRLVLALRGLRFATRDATKIPPRDLMRIDACLALATGRGVVDPLVGALFHTRALLFALRAGEPRRIASAMTSELAASAYAGGKSWKRTQSLMLRAEAVATQAGSPRELAWLTAISGLGYYLIGRFRSAAELMSRGEESLRSHGGKGFELTRIQFYTQNALWQLGRIAEASARLPALLAEAEESGDVFMAVNLRVGFSSLAWLAADDPEGARRSSAEAIASWTKRGFHFEHMYELWSRIFIELYAGDARAADGYLRARLPVLSRSSVCRAQTARIRTCQLRAHSALAMAAISATREEYLRQAERMARRIARERMPWAEPVVLLIRASACSLRGDRATAVERLRRAAAAFEEHSFALDAAAARYRLGQAIGGDEGDALVAGAREWIEMQGVKRPDRFVAMMAPGFQKASSRL